jgi:large subunit ribosomal protein L15
MADKTSEEKNTKLAPAAGSRKNPRRVGRGHGSGVGKTSGRGHKGQGARSGGKKGANYEGGQTPVHMRMRKLRGPTKKTSMAFEPFRTHTQPVNVDDLERVFGAGDEVSPLTLAQKGLATRKGIPVKVLGRGEITKKLDVKAAKFSAEARRKIEAAGGTCTEIEA